MWNQTIQHQAMFTRLYVEALLADEDRADQVREVWDAGFIPDDVAAWAWCILALCLDG
jgi:hypothetical protein